MLQAAALGFEAQAVALNREVDGCSHLFCIVGDGIHEICHNIQVGTGVIRQSAGVREVDNLATAVSEAMYHYRLFITYNFALGEADVGVAVVVEA